jgi:hypothetical protein
MPVSRFISLIALAVLIAFPQRAMALSTEKFQEWYPYYGDVLNIELFGIDVPGYNNCSVNHTAYKQAQGINRTNMCYIGT